MLKTVKYLIGKANCLQLQVAGVLFQLVPFKSFKAAGRALVHPEVLELTQRAGESMTLLPAIPGTGRFKHNLKYTIPLAEKIVERMEEEAKHLGFAPRVPQVLDLSELRLPNVYPFNRN